MKHRSSRARRCILAILLAAHAATAQGGDPADDNGGFEDGQLPPWVLTGAGAAVTASAFDPPISPAAGDFMGYITTLNNEGAEDFGYFDDSPDIDADGERESEYSSLSITFTTRIASVVGVDLNFLTDEVLAGNSPDAGEADLFGLATGDIRTGPYLLLRAVAPSDGSYGGTAVPLTPDAFTGGLIEENNFGVFPTIPDASRFQGQTGFQSHEFAVPPGTHTWTFFVADSHTDGVSSAMLIDNLRFTSEPAPVMPNFGTVTLDPDHVLDGAGTNVDSIAFWESPDPADTLMFVTGKGNDLLEVWEFPFAGNELSAVAFTTNINGVAVDQESDLLYVSDQVVTTFSLPGLVAAAEFGSGIIGVGENNLGILKETGGRTVICVSDDHNVHRFDAADQSHLGTFQPAVSSIETVLADSFYQMILVPEEQGPEGNPGVFAHHPDGGAFERGGTNRFGNDGEFDSDEEGILLYSFPADGAGDFGTGFIVVADQRNDITDFEFFDRLTWTHLGTLRLSGVSNTDGIASTQKPLPGYPLGLFAAIDDDTATVLLGWDTIIEAIFTPYDFWAADRGLIAGVNADPTDDPDNDGRLNLVEFATDGNPLSGADPERHRTTVRESGSDEHLTYTFAVRDNAAFSGSGPLTAEIDGVVYTVAGDDELDEFTEQLIEVTPADNAGLPQPSSGWNYRSFRLSRPVAESATGFIRVSISPATP